MGKTPLKISVETVVVCDDVRHEASGKTILVGVYNYNMVLEKFPAEVFFKIWVQLKVEGKGKRKAPIGIRFIRDKKELALGEIPFHVDDTKKGVGALIIPSPTLVFEKPDELKIDLQLPGKRWQTIKMIEIQKPEPSP
ncbi:MAG: hypothetical protein ISR48_11570 [Alphaproteobacteria bacterium]|nr:hypothetical protein [Alphaproteobacteria bacterium]